MTLIRFFSAERSTRSMIKYSASTVVSHYLLIVRHFLTFLRIRYQRSETIYNDASLVVVAIAVINIITVNLNQSPTDLEPALLASGVYHWEQGRFEPYNVNPPLVRMMAAVPTLLLGHDTLWPRIDMRPAAHSEFRFGKAFVDANLTRTTMLIRAGRVMCIPFFVLGAYCCFQWARRVSGQSLGGFIALTLWCTDPTVIAHAALLTNDVPAAAASLLTCYLFVRWTDTFEVNLAILAGLALGLSISCKFSCILLVAICFPLCLLGYRNILKTQDRLRPGSKVLAGCITAMLVSVLVVNISYCFEGVFRPIEKFEFVSQAFAGEKIPGNKFKEILPSYTPVPFPENFLLGIDKQKKDLEEFPLDSYLHGEWKHGGWWYYYIYGILVKWNVLTLLLALASIVSMIQVVVDSRSALRKHIVDIQALICGTVGFIVAVSSQQEFNIHFRYVLPAFGFIFVVIGSTVGRDNCLSPIIKALSLPFAALALTLTISNVDPLSYFNCLSGGSENGYRHMQGSSFHWGQDAERVLKELERRNITIQEVDMSYYDYAHWKCLTEYNDNSAQDVRWKIVGPEVMSKMPSLLQESEKIPHSRLTRTAWIIPKSTFIDHCLRDLK